MELRKKVEIFVDKMLKSDTPEGKREADSYFAELNTALTLEEQKEAGKLCVRLWQNVESPVKSSVLILI